MRTSLFLTAALVVGGLAATPASAQEAPEGRWQLKLLATGVLTDGKIAKVKKDLIGLPGDSQAKSSDNIVPTVAIEYFVSSHISIETICCTTEHHVNGDGALAGAKLVDNILVVPATVTVKYHVSTGPVRPYIGAGPAFFWILNSKPGVDAAALGATRVRMSSEFGAALQAGVDIPFGKKGFGFSLDAKRYFVSTNARFLAGSTEALVTRHRLDPWVLSAGFSFRF